MADGELARHAAAIRALRTSREFRRHDRLLGPICDALSALLPAASGPAPPPEPEPPAPPAPEPPAPIPEPAERPRPPPIQVPEADEPAVPALRPANIPQDVTAGAWSVDIAEPPPAPQLSRAERLRLKEKEVRRRLNSKGGEAEANGRVKRVMANTAGPAAVPGRVSATSPEAVDAIREMGRSGVPPAVYVKLYV